MTVPGVELVVGRMIKVTPAQTPLPGEMRVFSVPSGAEVRVNGTLAGTTPATIKNQPSEQALRIEVYQRGYRRMEQDVTLKPKEARTVNVGTLTAESGGIELRFASSDFRLEKATITVDGNAIDGAATPSSRVGAGPSGSNVGSALVAGPIRLDGLEVGSRTVEVAHPDYEPWKQVVTVRDQETTAVNVELKPKPGRLVWNVTGPRQAAFTVNGKDLTADDFKDGAVVLPAQQELKLEVRAPGYKTASRSLTLAPNGAQTWDVALEKLRGAEEGQAWTVPDLNLEMAYIRPGTFTMGSENGDSDEKPLTRVTLTKGYWLGKTEVTQGQYEALMGANPSNFKNAGRDAPVEQVSWDEAMQFCRKLTEREHQAGRLPDGYEYTLPTEAQWEYACRAGTTADYAGNLDAMAWYNQNSGNTTHPVAQKQANAWGLYDMHGNVWEWCRDWYGNYQGGSVTDPTGPTSGTLRVGRGGGWGDGAGRCRSAGRSGDGPGYRGRDLGFRLALGSVL